MSYAESLLADGERVIYRTRQHVLAPVLNARWALGVLVLTAVLFFVGNAVPSGGFTGWAKQPFGWAALVALLVGLVWLLLVYLRWAAEDYVVTDRRVLKIEGIINKHSADSSLDKINDAVIDQSFVGRIFGYGDLTILTAAEEAVDRYSMLAHALLFKRTMLNAKHDMEEGGRRVSPPLRAQAAVGAGVGGGSEVRRMSPDEVTQTLGRLADLRDRGAISAEEYEAKKADLLAQI